MAYSFFFRFCCSLLLPALLWPAAAASGNNTILVSFLPRFAGRPVEPEVWYYPAASGDSLTIETLRFYISGISFYRGNTAVYSESNSYHLFDFANPPSGHIPVTVPDGLTFDHIRFNLGIDSITNTSGAMGGDLDPTLGMYWTWQSGYINVKLEGKSNSCPARNHLFQFHLGGYLPPDYALQQVVLTATEKAPIDILLPLDKFLEGIDLQQQNAVMIPGTEACSLSRRLAQLFYSTQP